MFWKTPGLATLIPSSLVTGVKAMQGDNTRVILVVDDQEGNREVLRMFLGWSGYVVIEASNGLDAVNIATKGCPDLIIMDLAMPVMDGFTAVRLLRNLPETRNVPIVAYTAYDSPSHRQQASSTGFNEFLTKPIDFKRLGLVLDRFCSSDIKPKGSDNPAKTEVPPCLSPASS